MPTIWVGDVSKSFHEDSTVVNSRNQKEGNFNISLLGRHYVESEGCKDLATSEKFSDENSSESWLETEYGEESAYTHTGSGIFRSKVLDEAGVSDFTAGQNDQDKQRDDTVSSEDKLVSQEDSQCFGTFEFNNSNGQMGKVAYQTIATKLYSTMETVESVVESESSDFGSGQGRHEMVAVKRKFGHREIPGRSSLDSIDNRLKPLGLGSTSESDICSGQMEDRRTTHVSQRLGIKSGLEGNSRVRASIEGNCLNDKNGQSSGSDVYKEARRYEKSKPTGGIKPHYEVGREISARFVSIAYPRKTQSNSRFSKSHDSQQARMGIKPRDIPTNNKKMGSANNRPNGNESESEGETVLCQNTVLPSNGDRCSFTGLEPRSIVHISSIPINREGAQEDKEGQSRGDSNSSRLAQEGMVSLIDCNVNRQSMGASEQKGSSPTRTNNASMSAGIIIEGLEVERNRLRKEGFSNAVIDMMLASRKPSTNNTYRRVWKVFLPWLLEKGVTPEQVTVSHVLDFLQAGFDKNLSVRTLRLQTSAISVLTGKQWARDQKVIKFLTGVLHLRPPIKKLSATWSLPLVLKGLTKEPFEPLDTVSEMLLTLKTTLLIAITSARRVSNLQALSAEEPFTIVQSDKVVLRTMPEFLPKVVKDSHLNSEIILPSFFPEPVSDQEKKWHNLDIVRCLSIYLKRAKSWRKTNKLLIIPSGNRKGQAASTTTISRWIVNCIKAVYQEAGVRFPKGVKAHSTRAVSASWAFQAEVSMEKVCKAASWSSANTFLKHYHLDVRSTQEANVALSILGSVCE
ncbi:uncharacterized protein LOC121393808 [Xenopus laevis]|uniref:Uncharacterized protein LOC121393808 n=1 Tax=Xenopus laevis TaxID=8355 RepID=A0A8J1KPP8_XENLA|nr:uncharacterized protein LOC121393808 [Xenopus laevis]